MEKTCDCCEGGIHTDSLIKAGEPTVKTIVKTKKTKTPYKIVEMYEKEFKRDFSITVGQMAKELFGIL
jgi:hypothetical protein